MNNNNIKSLCKELKRMAFLGKPSMVMSIAKRIESLDSERNLDIDKLYTELIDSRKELSKLKDDIKALIKQIDALL